jgi:hypothetical protein
MCSELVVLTCVSGEDPAQVAVAEGDDVIKAFPAD